MGRIATATAEPVVVMEGGYNTQLGDPATATPTTSVNGQVIVHN